MHAMADSDDSDDCHTRTRRKPYHTVGFVPRPPPPHEAQASRYSTTGSRQSRRVFYTLSLNNEETQPPTIESFTSEQQNVGAENVSGLGTEMFTAAIDPLPETSQIMDPHDSYHYEISGKEAEFRLKAFQTRSYLTRYSVNHKQYLLSVYQPVLRGNEIKHEMRNFVITFKHDDRKIYQITDREFDSLEEMLETYESEKVDHSLPNIGRMVTEDDYFEFRQQPQEQQEITLENYIGQKLAQQPVQGLPENPPAPNPQEHRPNPQHVRKRWHECVFM
ncbi:uncharacterized protein LOC135330949 isoform X2 [Halichondria panicea]|uniref:uncharacterized protein LOC135330949 isoform X2 n=1 Tax=Halichondria panicea TaxID=6063 RepID=UPI00312B4810